MKNILFVLGFFLIHAFALSQQAPQLSKGKIIGKVFDQAVKTPLEYATVSLLNQDKKLITGTITDSLGQFEIEIPQGFYVLEIQFISYEKRTIDDVVISRSNPVYDAGIVYLKSQTESLDEVTVRAEKSELIIGLDKKTFNVGKDLSNAGNSASDILDNIPSVNVDVDGNVSLRGSQNLKILIDGKPSGLVSAGKTDALRSIQGSMIESVELITNPSARYEAEGMAGIINIILKKDQQKGVNGSFELSGGYPLEYGAGVNVNFRREKINYFINYGSHYRERFGDGGAYQEFTLADTNYITEFTRDRNRTGWSHNLRGGADFFINDYNIVTAAVLFGLGDDLNTTNLYYKDKTFNDDLISNTKRTDIEKEDEKNIDLSLNYEKKFLEKDRSFTATFHYIQEWETEDSDIEESVFPNNDSIPDSFTDQISINKAGERNLLFQADYVHPLGEEDRFEAGYRSEFRLISNPYEVRELDPDGVWHYLDNYTDTVEYNENIHAAYAQIGKSFGMFMAQLGLRAELSDISVYLESIKETNNQLYVDFFPTLHTTLKFNPSNSYQLSYSRRINRPHFWYLNPFYNYTDTRNIRAGNPNLKPEYTNAFESGYLLNKTKFNIYFGAYYHDTKGVIERVSDVQDNGVNFIIPYNLSRRETYGLESNLTLDLVDWWTFNSDVSFYRSVTNGTFEDENLYSDTYSWNTRISSRIKFPGEIDFQTSYFYRGRQKNTQGIRQPFYMMNMGLSKDILKGNGTITLNVRDVFDTRKFRFILDQPNLYSKNEFRWSSRTIRLSFIYRLNQKKLMDKKDENGMSDGGGMGF